MVAALIRRIADQVESEGRVINGDLENVSAALEQMLAHLTQIGFIDSEESAFPGSPSESIEASWLIDLAGNSPSKNGFSLDLTSVMIAELLREVAEKAKQQSTEEHLWLLIQRMVRLLVNFGFLGRGHSVGRASQGSDGTRVSEAPEATAQG